MSFVRARFFVALTLAASLAGCRPSPAASAADATHVGRAQLYRTGQAAYDRYFEAVYELQAEVARVPEERRAARAELAHALGLLPDAAAPRVVEAMHERAIEVGKGGAWFRVEGDRAVTEGVAPETSSRAVGRALDECLRSEAAAVERLRKVPGRARALWDVTRRVEAGLDADFFGFKRKEVKREVAAVRRALRTLSDEGTERLLEGQKFALDLTAAVSPRSLAIAGAPAAPPPEPERVEKKRAPGAGRKPPPERPSTAEAPAVKPAAERPAVKPAAERPAPKPAAERPAPKPPKPPKPAKPAGDDFNP